MTESIVPQYKSYWRDEKSNPIKTQQIVLKLLGDNDHWSIQTWNYRAYLDEKGETAYTAVGKPHMLVTAELFFGEIHVQVHSGAFRDRGFKQWERDLFNDLHGNFRRFVLLFFGKTVEELHWPKCFNLTFSTRYTKAKEYDAWVEHFKGAPVSHKKQCDEVANKMTNIYDAMSLLVAHGYSREAEWLKLPLKNARKDLTAVLYFNNLHRMTPKSEVPKWVFSGDKEVCKRRKAKIAKLYEHLLK